jgi:3-hydroxyisobutyrate dehydrogenase-like beta-hydroxyacid dehydrogenase
VSTHDQIDGAPPHKDVARAADAPGDTGGDPALLRSLRVALIGYGEVGGIIGRALRAQTLASIRTYDRLFDDPERSDAIERRALDDGVAATVSPLMAVSDADLVFSAVTAAEAVAAARAVAPGLREGAFYVDMNSASPQAKREGADLINAAGGRYVELAVMASVPPYGIRVPTLSGGPHAAAVAPLLAALGFNVTQASERYGVASAIKMCRSVVVKGMEAIVIESYLTARHYGVEEQVLASLAETFPGLDWEKTGDYFFQRVAAHGKRRAEEMCEAAVTVSEGGLAPSMAAATAERQGWLAGLIAERGRPTLPEGEHWRDWADWIAGEVDPRDER